MESWLGPLRLLTCEQGCPKMCTQVAFNLEHGPIRAASFKILVEDFVKVCRIRAGGGGSVNFQVHIPSVCF